MMVFGDNGFILIVFSAEMYARLFKPDGKLRTGKELAEFDAQKKAAPAAAAAVARSGSKKTKR